MTAPMMFFALPALFMASPVLAGAPGLTIRTGETWIFVLKSGQPNQARKVAADTAPRKGEVRISVRSLMGTSMSVSGNLPVSYTYRTELIRGSALVAKRSCTLPPNGRPAFEHWPETADAVRVSDFKPAHANESCP